MKPLPPDCTARVRDQMVQHSATVLHPGLGRKIMKSTGLAEYCNEGRRVGRCSV